MAEQHAQGSKQEEAVSRRPPRRRPRPTLLREQTLHGAEAPDACNCTVTARLPFLLSTNILVSFFSLARCFAHTSAAIRAAAARCHRFRPLCSIGVHSARFEGSSVAPRLPCRPHLQVPVNFSSGGCAGNGGSLPRFLLAPARRAPPPPPRNLERRTRRGANGHHHDLLFTKHLFKGSCGACW